MSNIHRTIAGDEWKSVLNHEWRLQNASIEDLDRALARLDANTYTMVTITGPNEQHLAVGGGNGAYVVYQTDDNYDFWNLSNPTASDERVMLNIGGQPGEFRRRQVVDLEIARAAAHEFLKNGRRDPALNWEKQ